jgi:hypothetical protein
MLHFYFVQSSLSEKSMNNAWPAVVVEALRVGCQTSNGAVPGAKLRQLIARIAPQYGMKYPPPESEDEKFGDFLKRFESLLIVLRRDGQDILVAPAEMPQLLDVSEKGRTRLREDLFEAFTSIPHGPSPIAPWYARESDTIEWMPSNETLDSIGFVRIPVATLMQELEDRKAFALSSEIEEQVRERLLAALSSHSALGSFSKEVRAHGLARKWHFHRFQAVTRRIKAWCEAEHIAWRNEWISTNEQRIPARSIHEPSSRRGPRTSFGQFVEILSDEDLRRISIPLDIVLKMLGS